MVIPDSDAAATNVKAYTWLTVQKFDADKKVPYPFKDYKTLVRQ